MDQSIFVARATRGLAPAVLLGVFSATAHAQLPTPYFVDNQSVVPGSPGSNNSYSENIDFGDVDLDGDWDAVFADGGDNGNDQNRIWINRGGLQSGGIGTFSDQTSARFPSVQDDSRDIEFADIDDDGDLDLYISNTAQITNQGNHWWVNDGGVQGGTLGFYTDETAARWVNLGVNTGGSGSSISPGALINGTFIDWSCDCDFGDLDNDGDLDLVHSSYGGAFSGNVPTRIFLNDGNGFFEEFNPSGFQLTGDQIQNGNPALWCEGVQQANTSDTSGAQADIASSALDIDLGDTDGDFDLDILHGARQELPRFFENRLEENGGVLGFRDVTNAVLPPGYSSGDGHYEQEMADFDFDGDLDIYGLNWDAGGFSFTDLTFRNDGTGNFVIAQTLSNSGDDDNEGDFFDYNNDGDLDLFVANFSGQSRLYFNSNSNPGELIFSSGSNSGMSNVANFVALDADIADIDKDGDYDIIQSNDNGSRNQVFENVTQVPDTHAPYIPNVEDPGTVTAGQGVVPLRAHVYDNAPYYITWYNQTQVSVKVDGFTIRLFDTKSSGGQVFRTEVPAQFVGNVEVRWFSRDEYGNAGSSAPMDYDSTTAATFEAPFGAGTADGFGTTPTVELLSLPIPGEEVFFGISGSPDAFYFLAFSNAKQTPPLFLPGIGNANLDLAGVALNFQGFLDSNGQDVYSFVLPPALTPGDAIPFQVVTAAPQALPNPLTVGTSAGLEMITQ